MPIDPARIAAVAATLRNGGRRPDPQQISITRVRQIGEQSRKLATALGSDVARRQPAAPSGAELAEITRITGEHPEWFATTKDTDR